MSNKNLFKEAIADAKAVREAALANAKVALEEALTPKLQSMLAAKLQEMDMEDEELEEIKNDEEKVAESFQTESTEDLEEDFDLSEILAELEDDDTMEEAKTEDEEEETEEETEDEEEETEELEVKDMSVEDLKDLIKDIVSQEMEAEEAETPADEEAEMSMDDEAELSMDNETEVDAEDEIDLEELLAELDSLNNTDELDEAKKKKAKEDKEVKKDELKEATEELSEAIKIIQTLRNDLNEVNLLNAKLLYVNKIFKAKNLTESQKIKVIASFDKANTVKEAKVVYESLQTTLTAAPKNQIKESIGFASKAAGIAPKKVIVESNDVIARMQKLANIK